LNPEPARPHVLVVAVGTAGDLYPFLRIARELIARGRRVTLLAPSVHEAAVRRAGVPFHGLGTEEEYRAALEHPDVWHPRKGFRVLWEGMRGNVDALPAIVAALPAHEPLAMLAHPLALLGGALARTRRPDLRIVAAWLAPANLRTVHDPMTFGPLPMPHWVPHAARRWLWRRIDAGMIDPVAVPDINAAHARYGLPPVSHFIDRLQSIADANVTLFPPWFAPTPADWPRPPSLRSRTHRPRAASCSSRRACTTHCLRRFAARSAGMVRRSWCHSPVPLRFPRAPRPSKNCSRCCVARSAIA